MELETMRYYYASKLWPRERLDNLLSKGKITKLQYDSIMTPSPDKTWNRTEGINGN